MSRSRTAFGRPSLSDHNHLRQVSLANTDPVPGSVKMQARLRRTLVFFCQRKTTEQLIGDGREPYQGTYDH